MVGKKQKGEVVRTVPTALTDQVASLTDRCTAADHSEYILLDGTWYWAAVCKHSLICVRTPALSQHPVHILSNKERLEGRKEAIAAGRHK